MSIKIASKAVVPTVEYHTLQAGQCFKKYFVGTSTYEIFIKTDSSNEDSARAVRLRDGITFIFPSDTPVIPVDALLEVSE